MISLYLFANQKRRLNTAVFSYLNGLFRCHNLDIWEELVDRPGDPALQGGR